MYTGAAAGWVMELQSLSENLDMSQEPDCQNDISRFIINYSIASTLEMDFCDVKPRLSYLGLWQKI